MTMTKSRKGKLQASITLDFYENTTEARITKGFECLNPGKIQRGLKQMFSAYHYKRRDVLRQVNVERQQAAEAAVLAEETASG